MSPMPAVHLTKDFAAHPSGAFHAASMRASHVRYQESVLANAINAKKDEISFLEASLEPQRLHDSMLPYHTKRTAEILAATKFPVFCNNAQGVLALERWEHSKSATDLSEQVLRDLVLYAYVVISITNRRDTLRACNLSQKEVIPGPDIDMSGPTNAAPLIGTMIDRAISAQLNVFSSKVRGSTPSHSIMTPS